MIYMVSFIVNVFSREVFNDNFIPFKCLNYDIKESWIKETFLLWRKILLHNKMIAYDSRNRN